MKQKSHTLIDHDEALRNMLSVNKFGDFFGVSQDTLDKVWNNLTSPEGNSVVYISMEIGADLDVFNPVKRRLESLEITDSTEPKLDYYAKRFLKSSGKIPNYSGGLGILAGDTLKSFADCKIPVAAVSLLYRKGYFNQLVDSKIGQIAWSPEWHPEITPSLYLITDPKNPEKPLEIEAPFFDRKDRRIRAVANVWMKMEINDNLDFFVPEFLLDYATPASPDWIQEAAKQLYDSTSEKTKAVQRRLLGAGIIPAMEALGLTAKTIHLNEQHGVSVVLHLIAKALQEKFGDDYQHKATNLDIENAAKLVAERIVYTIHTPVKAGHDRFSKNVYKEIGHSFCQRVLHLLAEDIDFPLSYNFTSLAMQVNRATNSVSRLHREVTRKQFPKHAGKITAITNGVHHLSWISDSKAELYDSFEELANWREDPSVFTNAKKLLKNKKFRTYFRDSWKKDTEILVEYINKMLLRHRTQMQETWIDPPNFLSHLDLTESALSPDAYNIGFARRFSTYKRADLVFEDIDTLAKIIVSRNKPVNFVFSGKAHPSDEPGKSLIKIILDCQKELYTKTSGLAKLVFIPGYDMSIAAMMVSGVHAWLNSPKRPLEASGTSGMKAAMNGIPNISIMDGWWEEGYHNGKTGWKFGYEKPLDENALSEHPDTLFYEEDSASFYELFAKILDQFFDEAGFEKYLDKCIMNLALNATKFNTHRMASEYVSRYNLKFSAQKKKYLDKLRKLYNSDY